MLNLTDRVIGGLILAALGAFLVLGGVSTCQSNKAAHDALRGVAVASKITTQVETKAAKRAAATVKREEKEDATIESALSEAPEWSSSAVPEPVLDGLRDAIKAADAPR